MGCWRHPASKTVMTVMIRSLLCSARSFLTSPSSTLFILPTRSDRIQHSSGTLSHCSSTTRRYCRGDHKQSQHDRRRPAFIVTLERTVGVNAETEADDELWNSGVFDAEVRTHLPPARTLQGLFAYYTRKATRRGDDEDAKSSSTPRSGTTDAARYLVRSVPVQTCRKEAFRSRLAAAAGVDSEGVALEEGNVRPANALLLMSGSHPLLRLPLVKRFFLDVYDGLQLATSMRDRGLLPKELALWAVANPLTEASEAGVERVRRKVELGADAILTQPPLAWEPFERWLRSVHASASLTGGDSGTQADSKYNEERNIKTLLSARTRGCSAAAATLLVGMPVITSQAGLRFWLELCGVDKSDDICREAFAAFESTTEGTSISVTHSQASDASNASMALEGHDGSGSTVLDCRVRMREPERSAAKELSAVETKGLPYGQNWFDATMLKLRGLGELGVSGVHVMAPGPGPRRRAKAFIDRGVFDIPRE